MSGGSSFAPGDRVEARFNGLGYYPATVKKDNGDDTYALEYDDGDKEDAAKAEHIKAMSGPARPPSWPSPTSSRQGAEEMGQAEAERSLGWMANYGCCVSKAEGERRRRRAVELAAGRWQRAGVTLRENPEGGFSIGCPTVRVGGEDRVWDPELGFISPNTVCLRQRGGCVPDGSGNWSHLPGEPPPLALGGRVSQEMWTEFLTDCETTESKFDKFMLIPIAMCAIFIGLCFVVPYLRKGGWLLGFAIVPTGLLPFACYMDSRVSAALCALFSRWKPRFHERGLTISVRSREVGYGKNSRTIFWYEISTDDVRGIPEEFQAQNSPTTEQNAEPLRLEAVAADEAGKQDMEITIPSAEELKRVHGRSHPPARLSVAGPTGEVFAVDVPPGATPGSTFKVPFPAAPVQQGQVIDDTAVQFKIGSLVTWTRDNAKVPKGTVGIIRSERSSDRWLVEFMGKPYGIKKSECELWHAKGVTSDGAGPEAPPAYINVGGWWAGLMRQSSKMQCVQANPVAEP